MVLAAADHAKPTLVEFRVKGAVTCECGGPLVEVGLLENLLRLSVDGGGHLPVCASSASRKSPSLNISSSTALRIRRTGRPPCLVNP